MRMHSYVTLPIYQDKTGAGVSQQQQQQDILAELNRSNRGLKRPVGLRQVRGIR